MHYQHQYCTRSRTGIVLTLVSALVAGGAATVFFTTSVGWPAVVFGSFFLLGFLTGGYRLVRPLTWRVEITGDTLRWTSPKHPCDTREISVHEIKEARDEISSVEVLLASGESARIPPNCVGDQRAVLAALKKANPAIRLFFGGQPVADFVPSILTGFKAVREHETR